MWALLPEGVIEFGLAAQGSWCWASTQRSWHHSVFSADTMSSQICCYI